MNNVIILLKNMYILISFYEIKGSVKFK